MGQEKSDNKRREEGRPDPEALLSRYHLHDNEVAEDTGELPAPGQRPESYQHIRGRLRIYLAAVTGAGKTYSMLAEGHRRKMRGTDVVVGYIETHGRPQTEAMLGDLEVIPRKKITYRGITLEEMDTEAIIARHPQVVLIDELAHSNVPGSTHEKRYQDVEDILNAGINVVTTLNIQHLDSLNGIVASITGVHVQETLPDYVFDEADEVELVDISPYALRQRLRQGEIVPPEQIEPALHNFFRRENLTALRELALRRVAAKADLQLQRYRAEHHIAERWPANERVLVGFDARPLTRQVIRDAWRLAHGLQAELIAVYVQLEGYPGFINKLVRFLRFGIDASRLQEVAKRRLEENAQLAEDLGAEVLSLSGYNIAETLVKVAREQQVTLIVLGMPARRWWEEVLRGSTVNRLLRMRSGIDIHLVPHGPEE
jgi:two-component system, OmpR family, sensor histidine kinase KdpD